MHDPAKSHHFCVFPRDLDILAAKFKAEYDANTAITNESVTIHKLYDSCSKTMAVHPLLSNQAHLS